MGRTREFNSPGYNGGPCPAYITGSSGCSPFAPTLANAPSGLTQLLFVSAGGNKNRYFIQQASRVAASCSMSYIGMDKANCSVQTTQLYTFTNSSGSLVWLIEPVSWRAAWQRTSPRAGGCVPGLTPRPPPPAPRPLPPCHSQVAPDPPHIDFTRCPDGTTLNVRLTPAAYTGFSGGLPLHDKAIVVLALWQYEPGLRV